MATTTLSRDNSVNELFLAMNLTALERLNEHSFSFLGVPPEWFRSIYPELDVTQAFFPASRFPETQDFLLDANDWWLRPTAGPPQPVQWEQTDAAGNTYALKMSAIALRRRQFLLIEHRDTAALRETERALERERLEKKELSKKFRILEKAIETMPLGVTITDTARKIFYTNPADASIHGYRVEELLGQDVAVFAPPNLKRQMTPEEMSTMKGWIRESVNVRKDGSAFPAQLMSESVKDDDGALLAIITTCEDITERKHAEKALSDERNLLRALIDNLPDLIYVKDRKGHFLLYNQAYAAFLGLPDPQTQREHSLHDLLPETFARQDEQYDRQVIQSGFAMIEHEETLVAQDGAEHIFLITRVPLHNERNVVTALVGICHDLTKRRQSEKQIEHLNVVLNAVRIVNQLIVRERDRKQLIQSACNHLVKARGYANAWMVLLNEAERVNFIAQSGLGEKFSTLVKLLRQGKMPPCLHEVLHTQSVHPLIQYTAKDDKTCCLGEWCVDAPKLAVKLAYAGKTYGALFVGLPPEISANQEELSLLEEIAGDMGFALYNIEVEEQRQAAEKAAQTNQQWLVATLRNLSEAVVTTNEHGAVTFFNPVAESLTGWKQEELIGKDMTFRIIAEDSELSDTNDIAAHSEAQPEITILLGDYSILIAKDGTKIPIEYSGSPIMNELGQFTGFVMIFKDITERKRVEEALEKSLSLLRSTLESTADGILALSLEQEAVPIFNQKFADMWQIPEAVLNQATPEYALELVRQRLSEPERFPDIFEAFQTPEKLLQADTFELQNGLVVEMFLQPRWLAGQCVGIVLSFHDITEQKRAEQALRYRMTFGNLINTISTHFINLTLDNIDQGMQYALQTIGEFTGVDHGYIALTPEYTRAADAIVTHEWWSPRSLELVERTQTLDSRFFTWAKEHIEQNGLLNIPSVEQLTRQLPVSDTHAFLRHSQSLMMIPLVFAGKLIGVLGFESLHAPRAWPDDIIALLRMLAEMFTGAFERKRAGEALEQERKRLFAVLEHLPAYIFLRDPRGTIRFANHSFRKRFGDPESPQTHTLLNEREGLWEDSQAYQVFATKTPQGWEWYHAPDNTYYQAYDYPFTDIDGSALVMEFGIEITDRKLMEMALEVERASLAEKVEMRTAELSQMNALLHQEILERTQAQIELEQAKEAAESASRAKSEFLANMSHELRTPLNAILGYAQILKNAPNLNERQTDGLDIIKNSGTHLLNLINEILDLSKIEAGFMELVFTDVHLPEFLKQIAEMIAIRAKQKGIDFFYDCDPRLAPGVRTDEKRLRQILINLLGNAVKFTERGSVSLRIRVCETPECLSLSEAEQSGTLSQVVRFEIADTGIGIAQEDLDDIFLPFQQVGVKRHTIEGTGLGLTISQKFVRLMGSRLVVRSAIGEGTIFHFDLKLEVLPDFLPTIKPAYRKVLGYKGKRRTLLIVDDRKENRMLLADMLIPLGFHILEAEDGQRCLEQLRAHRPDATLLDLRMPVMTGVEAMTHIRNDEELKEHVIFAVSASVYEDDRSRSLQAGCQAFLMKPIHLEELLEQLRIHLDLEWVYAETDAALNDTDQQAAALPAGARGLPREECETLLKLASTGRVRPLLHHLDTLDPAYHAIAEELRQYAKTFQLQAMIEKLQALEKQS